MPYQDEPGGQDAGGRNVVPPGHLGRAYVGGEAGRLHPQRGQASCPAARATAGDQHSDARARARADRAGRAVEVAMDGSGHPVGRPHGDAARPDLRTAVALDHWESATSRYRRPCGNRTGTSREKDTRQVRRIVIEKDGLAILTQRWREASEDAGLTIDPDGFVWSSDLSGLVPLRPDRITQAFERLCQRAQRPARARLS